MRNMLKILTLSVLVLTIVSISLQPILAQERNQEDIFTLSSDQAHDELIRLRVITLQSLDELGKLEQRGVDAVTIKVAYDNYLKHLKEYKEFKAKLGLGYGEI